ncbi:hypothetical protein [Clostridium sp. M14]|uniref:hypothetical protein n=1 Tax=Clostridium sp. M14 TaxID=2716311 RepID=UPI0013EE9367|nr:hypothetical protein [Clostridium sp. M14]MBZ9693340.1 hypothetical protein [Clostridium sp. M14]
MKKLKLDLKMTKELYDKHSDLIQRGECYNNCINILILRLLDDFKNKKYKIGYCYVGGKDYYLIRHCVLIHNNKVIDLSALTKYSYEELKEKYKSENIEYYVFAQLDALQLHTLLNKEDRVADLKETLYPYEIEILDICKKKDLKINDYDYNKYFLK